MAQGTVEGSRRVATQHHINDGGGALRQPWAEMRPLQAWWLRVKWLKKGEGGPATTKRRRRRSDEVGAAVHGAQAADGSVEIGRKARSKALRPMRCL